MKTKLTFEKGLKQVLILLGLLIFSPIVISLGFKALKIYTKSPEVYIAYLLTIIGVFLILFTVYFGFKTIKTILKVLFDN